MFFRPHDKERRAEGEREEALEIDVGAVHDVEGAGLGRDFVEDVDVVRFAVSNADKRWDIAMEVEQRVHLHGGLVPAKLGPGEQRQAQVDGGRVQRVETLIEIHADRIAGVQGPRDANQDLGEVSVDPPVVRLVGIGESGARNLAAKTHVVELGLHRTQAGLDVAQAFAVGQLGERQTKKLIPARKAAQFVIAAIASYAFTEFVARELIHQLCEDGPAKVHASLFTTCQRLSTRQNQYAEFKSINPEITLTPLIPSDLSATPQTVAGH